MTAEPIQALEIFYSYAPEDEPLRKELDKHLSLLRRQGFITAWYPRLVHAGGEWEKEVDAHLATANIILLLISADFLASDYCYGQEMKRALERYEAREAYVIPILLRPVDWQHEPFLYKLQPLPTNAQPVTNWPSAPTYDAAFLDIAQGIRRVVETDKNTVSTNMSKSTQFWNIPYRRNPFFTGREELLKQLHARLTTTKPTALTQTQAISGLGGIGKTQTALEYAYRYRDEYRAVLWARAATSDTLITDFVALAALLRLPEQSEQDPMKVVAAVKGWLATHEDWLLILDNADDLEMACDFLPLEQQGHILLTTRAQAAGDIMTMLDVEEMDQQEGILLLLRRAKKLPLDVPLEQASSKDRAEAQTIVTILDGLPLALDQAGAYIEETACSLSAYLALYQNQKHRTVLLRQRGKLSSTHPEPVATTWSLSFQQVEQTNPATADLLRLCAFLDPDAIPEEIISESAPDLGPVLKPVAADLLQLNEAIGVLRKFSLIRRNADTSMLSVHRLVQAVLIDSMKERDQHRWAERAVRAVNRVFPRGTYETWVGCQRYLPHAQLCAELINNYRLAFPEAAYLLHRLGRYFYETGQYEQVELLYPQALQISEQALSPNHLNTIVTLHDLALLYQAQGRYEQAASFYQQTLQIEEQALPPDHPQTAVTLHNFAWLYQIQGKYEQAELLYQRALLIFKQTLPPNHPNTAIILRNLASLYQAQGRYEQAESFYQQALQIEEQALPPNHPDTATTLHELARLYQTQGNYQQAEVLYQQALQIEEQALPPNHPSIAATLHELAGLYWSQGKYEQAEPLLQHALHIHEQKLPPNHPNTATMLESYALLLRKMKRDKEAAPLEARAKAIRDQQGK